ncbi:MAG: hypothetical protein LBQ66_16515 [Planctomycetaceae bacterium]|jgi:hypothetical protein|nr:hypothetical protein [Planctomycetaceae bacterium]
MAKKVEFNLALAKKLSFWVAIPLILILVFVFNLLAVASVTKKFDERKKALESTKSAVEKIRQNSKHPNKNTIDDIGVHTNELRGRVVTAWTTLEKEQRIRNLWPEDVGKQFIAEVSKLKFGEPISARSLEHYLNFMGTHIPKLEAKLDRRRTQINDGGTWKDKDGGGASELDTLRTGGRSTSLVDNNNERTVGVVEWPNPEIRNILQWGTLPSSSEVWYAQEDLWVYDSLIWVIIKSNEGAASPHGAVVKRIENMLIGQQASRELANQLSIQTTDAPAGPGAGRAGRAGPPAPPAARPMPGRPGAPSPAAGAAATDMDVAKLKRHERYVDGNNVPLPADAPPPFGEFNRMPICLRLIVDRQRIPNILVNCANCAMPIDVLSVRINPGGVKLVGGEKPSSPRATPTAAPGAGGGRQVAMDGTGLDSVYGANAVPIEIYGCINIFNPVDQAITEKTTEPAP